MIIKLTENKLRRLIKEAINKHLNEELDNSKYVITAKCNPYHARFHYHHQQVLRRNMGTPVYWIWDDNNGYGYTLEEAMKELDGYVIENMNNLYFEDDDSIKYFEEEGIDTSWYKGEGWYENGVLVYQHGDMALEDDTMSYIIEPVSDIKDNLNESFDERPQMSDEEIEQRLRDREHPNYDLLSRVQPCKNCNFAIIELDEKYNIINKNKQIISKQWFDEVIDYGNGYIGVRLNDQWNLIGKQGRILLDRWSDNTIGFAGKTIVITVNGSPYYLDKNGKWQPFKRNIYNLTYGR